MIYIKIPNIAGSVTAKGYEGWIEVLSIDHEVDREIKRDIGNLKNRVISSTNVTELLLGKVVDKSSPHIFNQVCSANKAIDVVELHFCKGSEPSPWLTYKLHNVLFTCYNVAAFNVDSQAINGELFSLNFTQIEMNYVENSYRTQVNKHSNNHVMFFNTILPDEFVDAIAGFGDSLSFGLTKWVREKIGVNNVVHSESSGYQYADLAGNVVPATVAIKAAKWTYLAAKYGHEYKIGEHFRIAPFGNRKGHPVGQWPHYHRRNPKLIDKKGNFPEGQSIRRHRPWENHPKDESFFDRF